MRSFGLKNVKAFEDTGCIQIAPLTIFVGKNSCGKSSFIRFPVVLAQTFRSGKDSPISFHGQQENYIDYGNFEEVLHNHSGNSFTVTLEYQIDIKKTDDFFIYSGLSYLWRTDVELPDLAKIEITYSKSRSGSRVYATKISLYINGEFFSGFEKIDQTSKYLYTQHKSIKDGQLIDVLYQYVMAADQIEHFMPTFDPSSIWTAICREKLKLTNKNETKKLFRDYVLFNGIHPYIIDLSDSPEKQTIPTDSIPKNIQEAIDAYTAFNISDNLYSLILHVCMKHELQNLHYIGPFRSAPRRVYRREEIERSDVGNSGDYTSSLLINDNQVAKSVSNWLKEATSYSIDIQEVGKNSGYYQLFVVDENNYRSNLIDVGYGISQVLPIVTQIAKMKNQQKKKRQKHFAEPEIIIIEQPELHLHPAAQSELATLFESALLDPSDRNRKIIIETHSEHLIRAIQVLIATPNNGFTNDMVKVYYVDKESNNSSIITEMKINEYGQFETQWPTGFFDKAYELSKELMRANIQRKYSKAEE